MKYKVEYTDNVLKYLKKSDRQTSRLLVGWVRKNLEGCADPRALGKALKGDLRDKWCYRIGDYRIMALISDDTVTILIIKAGHRREIYKDLI